MNYTLEFDPPPAEKIVQIAIDGDMIYGLSNTGRLYDMAWHKESKTRWWSPIAISFEDPAKVKKKEPQL